MKKCSKCRQSKDITEFGKNATKRDGLQSYCKKCKSEYGKLHKDTNARKESLKRYNKSAKGRKSRKRYEKSPKGKAARKKYLQSSKGRLASRKHSAGFKERNPDKAKAHYAIKQEVKMGRLPKPITLDCLFCTDVAKQYHHHLGYQKEHWLDVISLCRQCHVDIHKEMAQSS